MVWDPEGGKVLWWVLFLDQTTLCLLHILPRPGWQEWFTNKLRGSLNYLRLTSNNVLLNGLAWKSQCVSIALQEVSAWNKSGDISKDWSPWNQLVVHPASNHFLTKFALLDLISTKLTLTATPQWLTYWDANVPNGFDQPQRGNLRKITHLKPNTQKRHRLGEGQLQSQHSRKEWYDSAFGLGLNTKRHSMQPVTTRNQNN